MELKDEILIIEEPTFKIGDQVIATGYAVYSGKSVDSDYVKYGFRNAQFVLMTGTLIDFDGKVATVKVDDIECVFDTNRVVLYTDSLYEKVTILYDAYVRKSKERDMLIEDIKNMLY